MEDINCSAELMDNISFIGCKILEEECNIPHEKAEAMINLIEQLDSEK